MARRSPTLRAEEAPGGDMSKRRLAFVGRMSSNLDYWDGES